MRGEMEIKKMNSYFIPFRLYSEERCDFKFCYEWRKVVLRNELWSQLPPEIVEIIA